MKNLKLFISVFVSVFIIFSFVKATNCSFDGFGYYCIAGEYCAGPEQCECDGSMINAGDTCSTPCTWDGYGYVCVAGEYCPGSGQCECDGSMINAGEACNPSPTPPSVSCTYLSQTIFSGQSMVVYEDDIVPYTGSCAGLTITCLDSGGVGVRSNDPTGYDYNSCIVSTPPTGTCSLPWGGTINSGDYITAYQDNSVACGSTCVSETRTCSAGVLSGSYTNQTCSVSSCGGGGGGGGGGSTTPTCELEDLVCVDGIYEEADGVNCKNGELGESCDESEGEETSVDVSDFDRIGDISNSPYDTELNLAYLYAYNMGITDMDNIFDANMEGNLIRSHMAKMLVEWSKNVLGREIDTGVVCDFDDIDSLQGQDLYDFVIESCQMGLMGLDNQGNPADSFDPDALVTRAQFGTVLSRAIWGDYYNGGDPYYEDHLNALKAVSIMNNIYDPWMLELRGYVMLMLFRADELLNN